MNARPLTLLFAAAFSATLCAQMPGQPSPDPNRDPRQVPPGMPMPMPGMPGMHPMPGMPGMPGMPPGMMPPNMQNSDEQTTVAFLGIDTSMVDPATRKQVQLAPQSGILVNFVAPDSPAQKSGLDRFDILTRIDDQTLYNPPQLQAIILGKKPGDEIKLTFLHQGESKAVTVKLAQRIVPAGAFNPPGVSVMPGMPSMPGMPGFAPPGMPHHMFRRSLVLNASDMKLEIRPEEDKVLLTATAPDGSTIFTGAIDSPDDRAKIPANVREQLNVLAVDQLIKSFKMPPGMEFDPRGQMPNPHTGPAHHRPPADFRPNPPGDDAGQPANPPRPDNPPPPPPPPAN